MDPLSISAASGLRARMESLELLANNILPLCRYFAYVQVAEEEQSLWDEYEALAKETKGFAVRKAIEASQIYPVFRDLFKKEGAPT